MKTLTEYLSIHEAAKDDTVYVVYFNDDTMDSYWDTKEEAEKQKAALNKEMPDNECYVKQEPRSNFEK